MKDNALDKIIGWAEECREGSITESKYYDLTSNEFEKAFSEFIDAKFGKVLWREEYLTVFEDGYKAWLRGEKTAKLGNDNPFFELVRALNMPLEYFSCVPSNIAYPPVVKLTCTQNGIEYDVWTIFYKCVDDGGLFSDNKPEGKTYILNNTIGIKANLNVISTRPGTSWDALDPENRSKEFTGKDKNANSKKATVYVCMGYIEGITARKREHENAFIYVYNYEGNPVKDIVVYSSKEDDEATLRSFPKWKDYFDWLDAKKAMKRKSIMEFKEKHNMDVFVKGKQKNEVIREET